MPRNLFENMERSGQPHKLFFAICPALAVQPKILNVTSSLLDTYKLRGSATRADRLHVTLCGIDEFAGEIPLPILLNVQRAAASLAALTRPFTVQFNHVTSFVHRRQAKASIVLRGDDGVIGIEMLQQKLRGALYNADIAIKSSSGFNPHVTLIYGSDRAIDEQGIDPIGWKATEFVLIDSLVGLTRHETLGRWSLRG
jgi:2'-5' RNA ligase